ncbi:MAG TPA: tripartite tricarboxylate transporter TctB family protein [Vineibacter sp.]|nr:tripartite tricarboxylate transporter TctB family protein [Vineibacter sp.]
MSSTDPLLPHEQPLRPRVDLVTGAFFCLFGLTVLYLAWLMPTYADQKGELYTAPGLVPAFYGSVVAVLSVWLVVRSIGRGALRVGGGDVAPSPREGYSNARLALSAALGLFFVFVLLGRMPFWLSSAIFIFLFITLFEWRAGQPWRERIGGLALAIAIGVATGVAVTLLFERVFYVRLP